MTVNMLLYVALILYVMIMSFGFIFKMQIMFMIAGLLFFIPIFEINNIFIQIISVIMLIMHGLLGFFNNKGSDFE